MGRIPESRRLSGEVPPLLHLVLTLTFVANGTLTCAALGIFFLVSFGLVGWDGYSGMNVLFGWATGPHIFSFS